LPSGSDFIIEPSGSKNGKGWEIELADNPLKPGGIFLMVGITTVIIGGIIAFILWKKKKR
jgi:LPXTG-motif cell wall-anchored protein